MPITTPISITPAISSFCATIAPSAPTFIPVRPAGHARFGECFHNVQTQVAASGGKAVLGWIIWERNGVFAEAEHHAAWLSPDSSLLDITPKPDGESTILFLPDPAATFTPPLARSNKRQALVNDLTVHTFVQAANAVDPYNRRLRAGIGLSPSDAKRALKAMRRFNAALTAFDRKHP